MIYRRRKAENAEEPAKFLTEHGDGLVRGNDGSWRHSAGDVMLGERQRATVLHAWPLRGALALKLVDERERARDAGSVRSGKEEKQRRGGSAVAAGSGRGSG